MSLNKIFPDWTNWIFKVVSKTSDDVIPWWRYLAFRPVCSVIDVKKAITSCLTFASISWILLTLILPFLLTNDATPLGIILYFSIASAAAISTSSQILYLFSSDQILTSSFLEYLDIINYMGASYNL